MNEINHAIDNSLYQILFNKYPAEAVRQLEQLDIDQITEIFSTLPATKTTKLWERFSPQLAARILQKLPLPYASELLQLIEPNRGASILLAITDTDKRNEILESTAHSAANDLKRAMSYEPNTAGTLMESRVMYFRPEMRVQDVLNILRARPKRSLP